MGLKEELANLEQEEEVLEEEDRLSGIQESIYGLYRRIAVIVEYIDKKEIYQTEASKELIQAIRNLVANETTEEPKAEKIEGWAN